jgi:hypothetical protein
MTGLPPAVDLPTTPTLLCPLLPGALVGSSRHALPGAPGTKPPVADGQGWVGKPAGSPDAADELPPPPLALALALPLPLPPWLPPPVLLLLRC